MRLNKAQTRVLVDRKYTFYNYLGYIIRGGVPILYLSLRYNLFRVEDTKTITAWGIIAGIILTTTLWSKIKEVITDYNTYLGKVGQRAKMPFFFTGLSLILVISYVSIQMLLGVSLSLAIGGYIAMIPFTAYDKQNTQAKQMTALLEKENAETNLKELEELKNKTTK